MANLSHEYAEMLLPCTVFITTAGIIGVIGNAIVIVSYCCTVKDENGDRYFIPFLAFIDMWGSISMAVYDAMDNYFFFNYPSETVCQWLNFSQMFIGFLSACLLLVIAVQRYRKVCHPDGDHFTLLWRRISICLTVAISGIIMVPWFVFSGTSTVPLQFQGRNVTGTLCKFVDNDITQHYNGLIFAYLGIIYTLITIILVALVVLYALIAIRLRKVFQKKGTECEPLCKENREGDDSNSKSSKRKDIQTEFNMMYAMIVVFYMVSFLPTAVLLILAYSSVNYLNLPKRSLVTWMIFGRFIILNHSVNPFIYTYFDVKFRAAICQSCDFKSRNTH